MTKRLIIKIVLIVEVVGLLLSLSARNASAVPSFGRQTGMQCTACHTVWPELNSFGRAFKLGGYVFSRSSKSYEFPPPIAAGAQISFTHIEKTLPSDFVNNNWATHVTSSDNNIIGLPQMFSLFYGGRIIDKIGAFVQGTFDGAENKFVLDMADIRYANNSTLAGENLIYGFTLNNGPTLQDVWNSTPAFSFPFAVSSVAPTPAAATIIDGALNQQVGGIGAYAYWNNLIYGEVAVYRTTKNGITKPLGAGTRTDMIVDDAAPYWRLVLQRQWDEHSLSVGTYGMTARIFPGGKSSGQTDRFTDTAFDAQYERIGQKHIFTAHTTWIHENQDRDASFAIGNASNRSDSLDTFMIHFHYDYRGSFGVLGGSLGYFSTTGDKDTLLYSPEQVNGSRTGRPDSDGFILEADYLPWEKIRLSLQYINYDKFNGAHSNYDGSGRNASDNNTLYVLLWLMF